MTTQTDAASTPGATADPILLSLFANRFMAVAESMGTSLRQSSISTNIKERLDFSCAIFAPNGDLIANAPHLPVHLGSMSFAVRFQQQYLKGDIQEGDVIMTNHPAVGGSHLPDITLITPVHDNGKIVFFTASRGHHADIGGILPGSMPPTSKTIFEEGAQVKSFKIVNKGKYDRKQLLKHLVDDPASYPGCSGTRCLSDVESDLRAQIAANRKGAQLIGKLIQEYGLDTVQEYMLHIRDNAEQAVRGLLKRVAKERGNKLSCTDYLDDGTPIALQVTINETEGSAVFDFEGSGPEMIGNLNCPLSVTYSAIIYTLRAMVDEDIPLNQGCLVPIDVKVPESCLLNPTETAAVVGGNVCTSMRITDVVLKAFGAAADSQGCCNNLTFGAGGKDKEGNHVEGWGLYVIYGGYVLALNLCSYETICGGSGAGPYWDGTSGVHVHMTNTRITDPEILERRYPILLHEFSIRTDSAGKGQHNGGEGVIRDIEFLEPIQCSILSERRVHRPKGLNGGGDAATGQNLWIKQRRRQDGDLPDGQENLPPRAINLGGKQTVNMGAHDHIVIKTAGGGGYGKPGEERKVLKHSLSHHGAPRGSLADRSALAEGSS